MRQTIIARTALLLALGLALPALAPADARAQAQDYPTNQEQPYDEQELARRAQVLDSLDPVIAKEVYLTERGDPDATIEQVRLWYMNLNPTEFPTFTNRAKTAARSEVYRRRIQMNAGLDGPATFPDDGDGDNPADPLETKRQAMKARDLPLAPNSPAQHEAYLNEVWRGAGGISKGLPPDSPNIERNPDFEPPLPRNTAKEHQEFLDEVYRGAGGLRKGLPPNSPNIKHYPPPGSGE